MRHISFGWTTPPLVTLNKKCTRRDWQPEYAARFLANEYVTADDRSPRVGGKPVAILRLTEAPTYTSQLPAEDFGLEGFEFCRRHGLKVDGHSVDVLWRAWHIEAAQGRRWWVVRFEVESVTAYGHELAERFEEAALKEGKLL